MTQKIKRILFIVAIVSVIVFLLAIGFVVSLIAAVVVSLIVTYNKFKPKPKHSSDIYEKPESMEKITDAEYEIIDENNDDVT